jgi:hypothetical protein
MTFRLTRLVNICNQGLSESKKTRLPKRSSGIKKCKEGPSESKKTRLLKSKSLDLKLNNINNITETINSNKINLKREYNKQEFSLQGHFNKVLNQVNQVFNSQDPIITIADKKTETPLLIKLSDLLRAMFKDANPFKKKSDTAYLKSFFDIFFTSSIKIKGLKLAQSDIFKKYFSKGAFNEFRTKLALFYLKSANIIKDFVQVPTNSILDHKGFDFLIQKNENNGSDRIMALQVKSSDHYVKRFNGEKQSKRKKKFSRGHNKRVRHDRFHKGHGSNYHKPSKTSKTGILCINAGEKSLPDIANDIKSAIESSSIRSIPVSRFSEDTSQWLDTLIGGFSKKTTQAG